MINRSALSVTLATGLLLAGAAFLLVNESFQPFSVRFSLDGRDRSQSFRLETRQPLFLEYELVVRAQGRDRPPVVVTLNDRPVTVPAVPTAYSTSRATVPLPLAAVQSATNVLRVRVGGAESNRPCPRRPPGSGVDSAIIAGLRCLSDNPGRTDSSSVHGRSSYPGRVRDARSRHRREETGPR